MSHSTYDPDRPEGAPADEGAAGAVELPRWTLGPGGDFELDQILGQGGMSVVTRALQRVPRRAVALKRPRRAHHAGEVRALLDEGEVTAQVEHPNVVPVHGIGQDEHGDPVVVLREVRGRSLESLPRPAEASGWRQLAQRLVAVCHALEAAHHKGWVHCDVKTANVLVGEFGETWLVDWGIAQRAGTASGVPRGTPGYFAPEQARGEVVDERTDVFLLGATLTHVLSGEARHRPTSPEAYAEVAGGPSTVVWPPDAPPALVRLADRCCARSPADRPPDVASVRRALEGWIEASHLDGLVDAALRELDAPGGDPVADRVRLVKAQFALAQASGSPRAVDGLVRALDALIAADLADGNVVSARSWASGHPRWDDARERQLSERAAALDRAVRDRDLGGQRNTIAAQLLAMGIAVLLVAAVAIGVQRLGWVDDVAAVRIVVAVVLLGVYGAGRWWALRRRNPGLLARRLLDGGAAYLILLLLSRIVVGVGMRAPPEVATAADLVSTGAWTIGWWTVFRRAPLVLAGSMSLLVLHATVPGHDAFVLNAQVVLVVFVLGWELVADERRHDEGEKR